MENDPIPQPLRDFMATYLHPEVAGRYWKESVQTYFDSDPVRAEQIRRQLDEAIRTKSVELSHYIAITKDQTATQAELDQFLIVVRQKLFPD